MRDSGNNNLTVGERHDPAATIRALSTSAPWQDLAPIHRSTAMALAMHAGVDGTAMPTIAELSLYTGYSHRSVRLALARLREVGLVCGRVGRSGWRDVLFGDRNPAASTPLLVVFDHIGGHEHIAPFRIDAALALTDPLAVCDVIREYAERVSGCHLQIDLDVHAGTGTLLDGREVLGGFVIAGTAERRSA